MAKSEGPADYKPVFDEQAEKLCMLGALDSDLADFFGVTLETITGWKKAYPRFFAAIKKGRLRADMNVAESLYKRAMGYKHKATKFFHHQGKIVSQDYIEHYPPDVTAISLWLKARRPDIWRDNKQIEEEEEKPIKITLNLDPPEQDL